MMRRAECPGVEYTHVYPCPSCSRWHCGKENVPEIEKEVIPLKISARKRIVYIDENFS
jgi:hypothetical protein